MSVPEPSIVKIGSAFLNLDRLIQADELEDGSIRLTLDPGPSTPLELTIRGVEAADFRAVVDRLSGRLDLEANGD